ncbi:unnamed protein product [Spodoptera littoralis]|uniref:GDPGP1-like N-terminal domain-containing protein n=1 Tax=Spodoptera littoralis TaxID=7109 RepID=A0A9P0MYK5_SPOLI|nr:unnamed protein product [Spodoptera littoralis]CAH1634804.1 unnamed protein product [Spodoptera littoralis]
MYKLNNLTNFTSLLKTKWDEIHNETDIFRYKIDGVEERIVDGKYFLQLNPDRRSKRRTPEEMTSISQPFDEKKFHFNKVSTKEILFSLEGRDGDIHTVLVNVSPISRYHSLLCPSVSRCLPQVVTPDSLNIVVQVMFQVEDRDVRIGFNSICGFASVNHLHYHIFVEEKTLHIETVKWQHFKWEMYLLDDELSVPAFCFKIKQDSSGQTLQQAWKVLKYFLEKSIAHNILFTKRGLGDDELYLIVWPRRNTCGAKQLSAFNVAMLELSGWFPIYDEEDFKNVQAKDLEAELVKWKRDDFKSICENIKCIL